MSMVSPIVPVCQVVKEKIESKGDESNQKVDRRSNQRSRLTFLETIFLSFEDFNFLSNLKWVLKILHWVQLSRVKPKPSPTHSARESEWTKAKVVLHFRLLVFERNWFHSG
ncbi:hypothetical protein H5410_021541 [Solanum commersonii]|uniref:Uncharacterized protein n=1 Tax=Solanum commersonii TaxID=4109 RepID=A0A9J5ZFE6_SOLCO|nr:hypothetical protein H5410_021541 [Solanum commersonii]